MSILIEPFGVSLEIKLKKRPIKKPAIIFFFLIESGTF